MFRINLNIVNRFFIAILFLSNHLLIALPNSDIAPGYDSIVQEIDQNIQSMRNETACKIYATYQQSVKEKNNHFLKRKNTDDELYAERISELNRLTPVKLDYNEHVKKYIEIYTTRRKGDFEKIMGLAKLYFPLFEETLAKYNLPLELKYLAVVESSLNPKAVSKSGAVGLWQFLFNTSRMFDLEINSYIDERCDPVKSTEAACKYLQYLFNTFQDWQLAIASFNGGPGVVRNAIERSGGKTDYWELFPYLTEQMKIYLPAFIATNYVINYAEDHDIVPINPDYSYHQVDTVFVNQPVSFAQITEVLNIPVEDLRNLNPIYIRDMIPDDGRKHSLTLPSNKIIRFIRKSEKIYATEVPSLNYQNSPMLSASLDGKVQTEHIVQKGEFFHKIALKYNCSIENIKKWNNLTSDFLYPGQKLVIWIPKENAITFDPNKTNENETDNSYIYYVVQEGDTIWGIANKFNLKSIDIIKKYNEGVDENNLKPGQRLKIYW